MIGGPMLLHHRMLAVLSVTMSMPAWAQMRGFSPEVQTELEALKDAKGHVELFNVDPSSKRCAAGHR